CLASCFSLNLGFRLDVLLCLPFLERFLPLTPLSRRRSCAGLRLSKNCANQLTNQTLLPLFAGCKGTTFSETDNDIFKYFSKNIASC
ncbi:MAG: hypothetical protein II829_04365, partial [Bacteroidales bacterium]|nr:hypothetical protein [Bacteroidales bacterium]